MDYREVETVRRDLNPGTQTHHRDRTNKLKTKQTLRTVNEFDTAQLPLV